MSNYYYGKVMSDSDKEVCSLIVDAWLNLLQEKEDQEENQRRKDETFGLEVVN